MTLPSILAVEATPIPGLLVLRLPVHEDNRGWFKENWQRAKMTDLGLPDFGPVQNNISYNVAVGATRGLHAEPWDKFVSVAKGRFFGAWVDLRAGDSFGTVFTIEVDPGVAVFVPKGVANGYQTLEPDLAYTYLVNDHWSAAARDRYTFVNAADPVLGITWPQPLETAEMSEADRSHPLLADVTPFEAPRPLVIGATGQVGGALRSLWPDAVFTTRAELDLSGPDSVAAYDFSPFEVIVNAAAYTAVDLAETPDGRAAAWAANVTGVGALVERAREARALLVHVSSDYVFDGTREVHVEGEPLAPLGVYGQTKAAGDALVGTLPQHYVLRTSWVVGDGKNFVRTMATLAGNGVSPSVVDDQWGRLTFADDLARAIDHLVRTRPAYGTYNVSCSGPATTWADIAAEIYVLLGRDSGDVGRVSTEEYGEGKTLAPRPRHSVLDLAKLEATGFVPSVQTDALASYLEGLG